MTRLFLAGAGMATLIWAMTRRPRAIGHEPGITQSEKDRRQRHAAAPRAADFDRLTVADAEMVVDVPLPDFARWFEGARLEDILPGTERIPAVVRTELLTSAWSTPGSRRRVVLADGGEALEELIVSRLPDEFRYVVWNYHSDAARHLRYGLGRFRLEPTSGEATFVRWSYGFAPRNPVSALFLTPFVHGEWTAWMNAALASIRREAERAHRL